MTWLTNPYRFGTGGPAMPLPARQWRVWAIGSDGTSSEGSIEIAGIQMAETPAGPDISATGSTSSSASSAATVANVFDGNDVTNMNTAVASTMWAQKTFPSAVLLSEVRVQSRSSGNANPQIVVVLCRDDDLAAWDVVNVSTGLLWTVSEWKTFVIGPIRAKGAANALAWRGIFTWGATDSFAELSFDGITNNAGQAFASASQAVDPARKAFDGNAGTNWVSTASGEQFIGQVLATAAGTVPTNLTATGRTGTASTWVPTNVAVEWTDDLETWTPFGSATFAAWPSSPQTTQTVAIS